jgi:hypothetical protein
MVTKENKGIFVSASALRDFVICNYRTYFRLFEPGEAVQSKEMLMGSITHKVIEKAWKNLDVALNLGHTLCIKENLDLPSQQAVEHFIHTFFERFKVMLRDDDAIEKRFKVKLKDDVYLVGVFDRVSKETIIDWKTNANPPKKIDNDIQFIIYDYAYELLYGRRPAGLYLAALKDGSLVKYRESPEHHMALISDVIPNFVETIKKKNFIKTGLFTGACYRCPYKIPCLGERNVMVFNPPIEE